MRVRLMVLLILMFSATATPAQVSIGTNLESYPNLVPIPVPGSPVYYAPQVASNYFFYDGLYWVYQGDDWYASSWYNGPWGLVARDVVPVYVLRIPVRFYRKPPAHFEGWERNAPPQWGQHWGAGWEQQRRGWNSRDRRAAPSLAILPAYQRKYSGDRYPQVAEQRVLHGRKYGYQPEDAAVQEHYQQQKLLNAKGKRS
jgi:hypothetical protein